MLKKLALKWWFCWLYKIFMDNLQLFPINLQFVWLGRRPVIVSCDLSIKIYKKLSYTKLLTKNFEKTKSLNLNKICIAYVSSTNLKSSKLQAHLQNLWTLKKSVKNKGIGIMFRKKKWPYLCILPKFTTIAQDLSKVSHHL